MLIMNYAAIISCIIHIFIITMLCISVLFAEIYSEHCVSVMITFSVN